jgi:L-seryl-tRNA(Ser) seleniumtransferase
MAERIATAVDGLGGATAEILTDHTVSIVAVTPGAGASPAAAANLIARLRAEEPRIWAGEEFIDEGRVALNVQHLRDNEVDVVIDRLRAALRA